MTRRKNDNLVVLLSFFDAFISVRPYIDSCLNYFTFWKFDSNRKIIGRSLDFVYTMNQGLIQIKNKRLFVPGHR